MASTLLAFDNELQKPVVGGYHGRQLLLFPGQQVPDQGQDLLEAGHPGLDWVPVGVLGMVGELVEGEEEAEVVVVFLAGGHRLYVFQHLGKESGHIRVSFGKLAKEN